MPNVMVALPNTVGALCSTPQSLADAHWTVSSEHLRFMFLVSSLFFFVWFPCGRLSWLHVSFWAQINIVHHIISYHIILLDAVQ